MYAECHTRLVLHIRRHGNALFSSALQRPINDKREKMRILALHGYGQSSESFRRKTGSLRKQVKSLAEFVFIDALVKAPLREGAANKDSWRPSADESQWVSRRDALVRCVAQALWGFRKVVCSSSPSDRY